MFPVTASMIAAEDSIIAAEDSIIAIAVAINRFRLKVGARFRNGILRIAIKLMANWVSGKKGLFFRSVFGK